MSDLTINNSVQSSGLFTKEKTYYSVTGLNGPFLIFIHGVGLSSEIWGPQVDYFSKNYTVVTYDFLGHGLTPPAIKKPTIEDYVQQLDDLINALGVSSFSLIGHSMGAIISVAYSLKYNNKVNALIPLNIVYKRSPDAREQVLDRANKILKSGDIGNIEQTMGRWFENKTRPDQTMKIKRVRRLLLSNSPEGYGLAYKLFAVSDSIFENLLDNLSMPVLYLTGSDDPNSNSRMSLEMANESPNGLSRIIDDEAHMMAYIAPEKVNPIIEEFLKENV